MNVEVKRKALLKQITSYNNYYFMTLFLLKVIHVLLQRLREEFTPSQFYSGYIILYVICCDLVAIII